jgi:hypothetical protein
MKFIKLIFCSSKAVEKKNRMYTIHFLNNFTALALVLTEIRNIAHVANDAAL